MNQDDIYNLLLILLLMSNERENGDNAPCPPTVRGSLNELILASMLISSNSGRETATTTTNACGRRSTENTTF